MRFAIPLVVALALIPIGCRYAVRNGPIVVVTASYGGASAQVVAETVAAPIEQQVNGVEHMVRLESESRSDGSYIARVRFQPNTDPNLALRLVRDRVALANPVLPEAVRRAGVAVKVGAAEVSEKDVTIALVDRGESGWDALRRFSQSTVKRLSADGAIVKPAVFPGPDEKQVRVYLDRAKCAKYGVSFAEVMKAVQAADPGRKIDDLEAQFAAFGDRLVVPLPAGAKIDELKAQHVRSTKGDSVSLGTLAAIGLVSVPSGVYRVDMYPAVRITGLPPQGMMAESAAARCAELADAERKSQHQAAGFTVVNLTGR